MLRSIVMAFAAAVSFFVPNLASAQGNLGSHYRETVLNFTANQVTPMYLPIPRTGWPVRVQVTAVDDGGVVFFLTSLDIADGTAGNPVMTIPTSMGWLGRRHVQMAPLQI